MRPTAEDRGGLARHSVHGHHDQDHDQQRNDDDGGRDGERLASPKAVLDGTRLGREPGKFFALEGLDRPFGAIQREAQTMGELSYRGI